MPQSFAISVGNANSYVAASRGGGVEILLNEYSTRSTPTYVAFNQGFRSMGNDAASYLLLNPKNTIYDLMVLLGKSYDQVDQSSYPFKIEEGPDNQPLVVVRFLDEEKRFTITQVLAMLFTKLRETAGGATECVISYPQFFDSKQRDELAQAALIAGLKPLQVISDMAAIIMNFAYFRTTKDDEDKFIAFVNFGQSNLQTAIAWFTPKDDEVRILAADSEPIGGRDFDKCLAQHFIATSNLNLKSKQYLKLITACEKLKRLLSANANDIPINVESLISEEQDFSARMDRSKFEEISVTILQKVEECLKRTLEKAEKAFEKFKTDTPEAGSTAKTVEVVEIVGGSTRMPAIKQLIQKVFNIVPSTTLNTDEAVARGCVLHGATLHPGIIIKREIKLTTISGDIANPISSVTSTLSSIDSLRRIELEMYTNDRNYKARTEARNNLEEFIYAERSKLNEGDQYLQDLSEALDWLFSDEGEEASEETYNSKLVELKKICESRRLSQPPEPEVSITEINQQSN